MMEIVAIQMCVAKGGGLPTEDGAETPIAADPGEEALDVR
jgi:hypothetical protein